MREAVRRVSLLPETASFEELVQDCFLVHRGAGLMLSPLDVEVIGEWAESGVPFEVIGRGIRRAAEKALWDARPGEPVLRTLRACRREVEAEIRKYRARAVGAGSGSAAPPHAAFLEERHKRLRSVVKKAGRDARLSRAADELRAGLLAQAPSGIREADRREERVTAALLRALPFRERLQIYREATQHAGDPRLTSAQARKLSRRFHRHALLRRAIDLPAFW